MIAVFRVFVLACALVAMPAAAGPLDDARAAGLVGERVDGYVGAVPASVPADVRVLIDDVNAQRRAKYEEVARQRGVPVDAVAAIAGEKLIARTPSGHFVAGADGRWRRK